MNKVLIPALLVATVMVAGAFAFMPVEQASTVHASSTATLSTAQTALIADEMLEIREITGTDLDFGDASVAIQIKGNDAADRFELITLIMKEGSTTPASAGDDCVIDSVTVDGALVIFTASGDIDCGTTDTPIELISELDMFFPPAGNVILFELSDGSTPPEDGDHLNFVAQILIKNGATSPDITIE